MKNPEEKIFVGYKKPEFLDDSRERAYYMDGEKALEYISQRPELENNFRNFIEPEDFRRLKDPDFKRGSFYQNMVERINSIGARNLETNRVWYELLPDFINEIWHYLREKEVNISWSELQERTRGLLIICLDIYRFYANVVRLNLKEDDAGFYSPENNLIAYRLPESPEFRRAPARLQIEHLKKTVLHELIHALAAQSIWIAYREEKGKRVINRMQTRRTGIGNIDFSPPKKAVKEKLVFLNEAVTQKITLDILPKILSFQSQETINEYMEIAAKIYEKEMEVLNILTKKINWSTFLDAYFTKKGLRKLNYEIKENFGLTLSQVDDLMKKEKNKKDKLKENCTFEETKKELENRIKE